MLDISVKLNGSKAELWLMSLSLKIFQAFYLLSYSFKNIFFSIYLQWFVYGYIMYHFMNGCIFRIRNSDSKQRSRPGVIIKIKLLHCGRLSECHLRHHIMPRIVRLLRCFVPKCSSAPYKPSLALLRSCPRIRWEHYRGVVWIRHVT